MNNCFVLNISVRFSITINRPVRSRLDNSTISRWFKTYYRAAAAAVVVTFGTPSGDRRIINAMPGLIQIRVY